MVDKRKLRDLYELQARVRGPIRWTDSGFNKSRRHKFFTQTVTEYLNNSRLRLIRELLCHVVRHLQDKGTLRDALDVGCAEGFYVHQLSRIGFAHVIGTDISCTRIKRATQRKLWNEDFLVCDAEYLPFRDDSFDFILCSEVFEHLLCPNKLLSEVSRMLTRNGQLVLTTPSSRSFVETRSTRIPLLSVACDLETIVGRIAGSVCRTFFVPEGLPKITEQRDTLIRKFEEHFEHINLVDAHTLVHMLCQSNLDVARFRWSGLYIPFLPISVLLNICPAMIMKLEKTLAIVKPEPFLWTIIVLCGKSTKDRMACGRRMSSRAFPGPGIDKAYIYKASIGSRPNLGLDTKEGIFI